ncbi:class IV adenylate cyclase [Saccharothrix syringae]|uniref:CYTH domain-containing protein n=1 Tax=Saccharothrix syringae TaxID=103733 RepID=A0A5Q0GUZ9_SACSY|nr:CYTH domain-containing protein [Saccharothrix syringae]QFZ17741.1 CYTH domain-containing protein [Saccharothrix syringae]
MAIEFEAKVLDVDPVASEQLILARGGVKVGDRLLRRFVYDIQPGDQSRWVRLRDTGDEITLTVKEIRSDAIGGTIETEVVVDDFDKTNELLGKLGYAPKSYQENRRSSFTLDEARLEIDHWPLIAPYLEIEADSAEEVKRVATALGYDESELTTENTVAVYARYGIDLATLAEVRFE